MDYDYQRERLDKFERGSEDVRRMLLDVLDELAKLRLDIDRIRTVVNVPVGSEDGY